MAAAKARDKDQEALLVIAIDFGTTFSGFAFSFRNEFERNPLEVRCLNIKSGEGLREYQAAKVPTCVLFSPEKEFVAFGKDAEDRYAKMCIEEKERAKEWYFFGRFKMELHDQETLSRDQILMDETEKKSMPALDVFSAAIRFLRDQAMQDVKERGILLRKREIKWVLTVPAIWDDGAKQFMREAAAQAGIREDQIILALEPEAASVYCLSHFQRDQETKGEKITEKGKRFVTVDCGGGTVDISVFEVTDQGRLKQLHRPEGAPCGGVKVDDSFLELLRKIVTNSGLMAFDNMEKLELERNFEQAKPSVGRGSKVAVRVPSSVQESISKKLSQSKYKKEISMVRNHLLLPEDIAVELFSESKEGVVETLGTVLEDAGPVDAILLVGGLSESRVIQDAVREAFPEMRVLVSPFPSLTVVMGAVQYGHCPQVISTRVAAFTYGVDTTTTFIEGEHDEARAKVIEGEKKCDEIFSVFIRIDDIVSLDQQLPFKTFTPSRTGQTEASFNIYRTRSRSPKYVTEEGCEKIGHFTVEMPDLTGEKKRKIQATMCVSGTDLKVLARDGNTGKEFSTSCDFLNQ